MIIILVPNDNNKTVRTDNGRGGRRVYNDRRDDGGGAI